MHQELGVSNTLPEQSQAWFGVVGARSAVGGPLAGGVAA